MKCVSKIVTATIVVGLAACGKHSDGGEAFVGHWQGSTSKDLTFDIKQDPAGEGYIVAFTAPDGWSGKPATQTFKGHMDGSMMVTTNQTAMSIDPKTSHLLVGHGDYVRVQPAS
jgi:hypothetical protein